MYKPIDKGSKSMGSDNSGSSGYIMFRSNEIRGQKGSDLLLNRYMIILFDNKILSFVIVVVIFVMYEWLSHCVQNARIIHFYSSDASSSIRNGVVASLASFRFFVHRSMFLHSTFVHSFIFIAIFSRNLITYTYLFSQQIGFAICNFAFSTSISLFLYIYK